MLKILPPLAAMAVITAARLPGAFFTRTSDARHRQAHFGGALAPAHIQPVIHVLRLVQFGAVDGVDDRRPRPASLMPTMRSPGKGWQHWPSV